MDAEGRNCPCLVKKDRFLDENLMLLFVLILEERGVSIDKIHRLCLENFSALMLK